MTRTRELPPSMRDEIHSRIAGAWLPIEFGLEHYRAVGGRARSGARLAHVGQLPFVLWV